MTESQSTPALGDRRKRRRLAIAALGTGAVVLVAVLIIVLGGDNNNSVAQSTPSNSPVLAVATSTSAATTTHTVVVSTTNAVGTTESTTMTTVADTSVASTTTQVPTSSTQASVPASTQTSTTTVAAPATIAPATAPPVTAAPVTPVTAPAIGNCTNVGAISIPATKTLQPILAETQQFSDGLLCGNHKSDHVDPGVDILPGFAPFAESVAGGPDLIGKVPAIIFGHRNSHNRPFYSIDKLQQGDAVSIRNLDGSTIDLKVDTVVLMPLADATTMLLAPSTNGDPQLRLVACSHADGTPGGVNYRWIATLVKA